MVLRQRWQHHRELGAPSVQPVDPIPVDLTALPGTDALVSVLGSSGELELPPSLIPLLYAHEPLLVYAVDAEWSLLASNYMLELLIGPVSPALLVPPVNVMRLVLHPAGVSARLENLAEVHTHLLRRLRRQIVVAGSDFLVELEREVSGYRQPAEREPSAEEARMITMPVRLWVGQTLVNLLSVPMFFGTPWEGAVAGVTTECLLPADEASREFLFDDPTRSSAIG